MVAIKNKVLLKIEVKITINISIKLFQDELTIRIQLCIHMNNIKKY